MNFFQKRRIRKMARGLLHHAKYLRDIKEDLLSESDLRKLSDAEKLVRDALKAGDIDAVERAGDGLYSCIGELTLSRPYSAFAENFEIFVVAVIVAMAVRTYFVQPFKIPTGSMRPTLYGIYSQYKEKPSFMDRMPMKLAKWFVYGDWYKEVRVETSGHLSELMKKSNFGKTEYYYRIAGKIYKVPKDAIEREELNFRPSDYVPAGSVLWSGIVITGDHVFVDRIRWNFSKPKRGQIIVFSTQNISSLQQNTHYIKRLVGLPGENVAINPPNLVIDGQIVTEPEGIGRIAKQEGSYKGYVLPKPPNMRYFLSFPGDSISLADGQYFALGDNTYNSKDGRYWGSVPKENTVGPAFMVYWPFSRRWGLIR